MLICHKVITFNTDPIVGEGTVEINFPDGATKKIGLLNSSCARCRKIAQDQHPSKSYIDLNRSGF